MFPVLGAGMDKTHQEGLKALIDAFHLPIRLRMIRRTEFNVVPESLNNSSCQN